VSNKIASAERRPGTLVEALSEFYSVTAVMAVFGHSVRPPMELD
jgi:hypothetical protein